jgi:hypothetical protein
MHQVIFFFKFFLRECRALPVGGGCGRPVWAEPCWDTATRNPMNLFHVSVCFAIDDMYNVVSMFPLYSVVHSAEMISDMLRCTYKEIWWIYVCLLCIWWDVVSMFPLRSVVHSAEMISDKLRCTYKEIWWIYVCLLCIWWDVVSMFPLHSVVHSAAMIQTRCTNKEIWWIYACLLNALHLINLKLFHSLWMCKCLVSCASDWQRSGEGWPLPSIKYNDPTLSQWTASETNKPQWICYWPTNLQRWMMIKHMCHGTLSNYWWCITHLFDPTSKWGSRPMKFIHYFPIYYAFDGGIARIETARLLLIQD